MDADTFCRSLTPRFATVAGIHTHYVECGDGPTVVLVHGLSSSFWNWWRNLAELSQYFHIIAYDLMGCGQSAKPHGRYTTEACVAQLEGLLDHLSIKQAALVAHSMGARVALNSAIALPHRVRALTLVSPSCYPQTAGRAVDLLVLPGIGEIYTHLLFTGRTPDLVRRTLRYCMHSNATVTDNDVYWNMLSGQQKRRIAAAYLKFGRHMRFHKPWPMTQRYCEITVPTLIINGDSDRFVPESHVQQLAAAIPSAKLELWNNTGHLPHAEHPHRFNNSVMLFLRHHLEALDENHRCRQALANLGINPPPWLRRSSSAHRSSAYP